VEERYCGDNPEQSVTARMTDVVQRALSETSGDILAFLPGDCVAISSLTREY
jgi:HrpA-like RNA helicase